jgi:NADPH-dependent 2,4-dienoyl-CoA reductase/sulfur reductase-like enzyme/rhodanese-related sulfurtransferase
MDMKSNYSDFIIIGGVAAGPKTAATLARRMPNVKITLFEKGEHISYGACGLPYFASGDINNFAELTQTSYGLPRSPEFFKKSKGFEVITGTEVIAINRATKTVIARNVKTGESFEHTYGKLIFATGALPNTPLFPIPSSDRVRSFTRPDDAIHFRTLAERGQIGTVLIIGGGFIGCELAETCGGMWGIETTLMEKENQLLPYVLDSEMSAIIERELERKKIGVLTNTCIKEIKLNNDGDLLGILSNGKSIAADYVFLCLGVHPNASLARETGLKIGETGGIVVNGKMQTSDTDIYAGGDCVELYHQTTKQKIYMPMGSLANRHGWIIAENLSGHEIEFPGVLGAFLVKIFDLNIGAVGLSQLAAQRAGFKTRAIWGSFADKPDYYPESNSMTLKMIYSPDDNKLLGLQAIGNGDIFRRIDVFSSFLQNHGLINDLLSLEHGYAPPYAEALDPLHHLASMALAQERGMVIHSPDYKPNNETIILDVREKAESEAEPYPVGANNHIINIPLNELTEHLNKLDYSKKTLVICKRGPRAYQAALILKNAGFENLSILGGGMQALI